MSNKEPRAMKIFKKYFTDTELGKEYNLYNTIINAPKLSESKADVLVSTVLEQAQSLNRTKLDKEKYNLIKEIKKHYDLDNFFKAKIDNYRVSASISTLIECQITKDAANTKQIISNKINLLEHITKETLTERKLGSKVVEDFMKEDKEIRLLAYKILVEKFNSKYSVLSDTQKEILKEYINNVSDTKTLREFLNKKLLEVKTELVSYGKTSKNKVLQIKLNEVVNFIKPIANNEAIKDEVLIGLMQYYQLLNELKAQNNE
jgi:hypothetical protein